MIARGSADPLGAPFEMVGGLPVPIVAEGLGFTYAGAGTPALAGIHFRIEPAGVLLVVGPSGSGKSTLARAIAGIIPREIPGAWTGSLRIGDLEVSTAAPGVVAAQAGILFQDPGSQLVMERAGDDVAFGLENRAWPLGQMRQRVPDALAEAGLGGFAARRGTTLSGGEQQRLALAGVVAPMPGVLIFDEPTANLDPVGTADFFDRLAAIREARSATLVLVEHRADRAWPLADLVLALDSEGRMIDLGAPDAVVARSGDVLARAGVWLPGSFSSATVAAPPPAAVPATVPGASTEPGLALVEVRELRHEYARGLPSIRDIDLTIGAGERVALIGPNGSGKSTLLRLVAGLLRPAHGTVLVAGKDPARLTARRLAEQVGFVFQDPELGFVGATVEEEVMTGLAPDRQPEANALMARLGLPLEVFSGRSPYRLSGGEQRRLSVATALVRGSRLLLLDEPTFGQDRTGWEAMAGILRELVDAGVTVIAATHDERFATQFATRRITLADGWVVADDGPGGNQDERAGTAGSAEPPARRRRRRVTQC